jgi:ABC-type Fe3+ transport system permease subunit
MSSIVNSAVLAAGAMSISLPIGTLLAVLLTRCALPGRRVAAACLGVLLFLPLYVQLSGWEAAVGKLGWYSLALGSMAQPVLDGMRGAIIVHGLAAVPWATLLVAIGLCQVDPAQEEAALLSAPPIAALWRITLPQSLPVVVVAAIWTVVGTTSEMTVTNIYLIKPGDQTLTEAFYMKWAQSGDAAGATVTALPGLVGLALLIFATLWMVLRLTARRVLRFSSRQVVFSLGGWRPIAAICLWSLVIVLLGVPIASLITKAGFVVIYEGGERIRSWSALKGVVEVAAVPRNFASEIAGTLEVATGAAALALWAACFLAWRARCGGWAAWLAIAVTVLCLAVPGPLVGATLIQIFNHDLPPRLPLADGLDKSWLLALYDHTPFVPMIAQAVRALPLGIILLWHSFSTIEGDVLEAAALDGMAPRRVFWKIGVPTRWRAILATFVAAFAVAAGDLAWAHLVTPPGLDLLSRRVFGLVHSGVEEQVAAISLAVILAYAALVLATWRLLSTIKQGEH